MGTLKYSQKIDLVGPVENRTEKGGLRGGGHGWHMTGEEIWQVPPYSPSSKERVQIRKTTRDPGDSKRGLKLYRNAITKKKFSSDRQ